MSIQLDTMTKETYRRMNQDFAYDPDLFMDMSNYHAYVYDSQASDDAFERHQRLGRIHLAVMLEDEPVGDIALKNIDHTDRSCSFGIHLKNDSYKNKGYGTQAEILMMQYAVSKLGLKTIYADAVLKNQRSQHVLKKVGFVETHCDDTFCYFKCDLKEWACKWMHP